MSSARSYVFIRQGANNMESMTGIKFSNFGSGGCSLSMYDTAGNRVLNIELWALEYWDIAIFRFYDFNYCVLEMKDGTIEGSGKWVSVKHFLLVECCFISECLFHDCLLCRHDCNACIVMPTAAQLLFFNIWQTAGWVILFSYIPTWTTVLSNVLSFNATTMDYELPITHCADDKHQSSGGLVDTSAAWHFEVCGSTPVRTVLCTNQFHRHAPIPVTNKIMWRWPLSAKYWRFGYVASLSWQSMGFESRAPLFCVINNDVHVCCVQDIYLNINILSILFLIGNCSWILRIHFLSNTTCFSCYKFFVHNPLRDSLSVCVKRNAFLCSFFCSSWFLLTSLFPLIYFFLKYYNRSRRYSIDNVLKKTLFYRDKLTRARFLFASSYLLCHKKVYSPRFTFA